MPPTFSDLSDPGSLGSIRAHNGTVCYGYSLLSNMSPNPSITPALSQASSSKTTPSPPIHQKYACRICASRKVKCNKLIPCSNCVKAQVDCVYGAPTLRRPRKRAADEDLLARLANYEDLMRKNNVDFSRHATTWATPGLEKINKNVDTSEGSPVSIKTDGTGMNTLSPIRPSNNQKLEE